VSEPAEGTRAGDARVNGERTTNLLAAVASVWNGDSPVLVRVAGSRRAPSQKREIAAEDPVPEAARLVHGHRSKRGRSGAGQNSLSRSRWTAQFAACPASCLQPVS